MGEHLLADWSLTNAVHAASITPFVTALITNTLPPKNFNVWLHNDYIYVRCAIHFLARLIVSIPAPHQSQPHNATILRELDAALRTGYSTLVAELDVFRSKASQRGLTLPNLPPTNDDPKSESTAYRSPLDLHAELVRLPGVRPECAEYIHFMMKLGSEAHWTTHLTVLWISEKIYCDAFCAVVASEGFARLEESVRGFAEWWSGEEFRKYLEYLGDTCTRIKDFHQKEWGWKDADVKRAVEEAVKGEVKFWEMAMRPE